MRIFTGSRRKGLLTAYMNGSKNIKARTCKCGYVLEFSESHPAFRLYALFGKVKGFNKLHILRDTIHLMIWENENQPVAFFIGNTAHGIGFAVAAIPVFVLAVVAAMTALARFACKYGFDKCGRVFQRFSVFVQLGKIKAE